MTIDWRFRVFDRTTVSGSRRALDCLENAGKALS